MKTMVLAIEGTGICRCLYSELIDLASIGRLEVKRAGTIEFNNQTQNWEVKDRRRHLQFFARSREQCIEWEHQNLT